MAYSLENKLVVAISSRALFNLDKENEIFEKEGAQKYIEYQVQNENTPIEKGTAYSLIKGLLKLNESFEEPIVEVIVMSRNTPESGLRIFNTIDALGLDIKRAAFTGGESISKYLSAFKVDLFLSKHTDDVQDAINAGFAAALVYDPPSGFEPSETEIRLAFDGDAVIFSEGSELVYKTQGIDEFEKHEIANELLPLGDGPFAKLFRALFEIKKKEPNLIRIALVTSRNIPTHKRVILTFRNWGVNVDEAFFMGGVPKHNLLKAFNPHIFFDDQEAHLDNSAKEIPSAKVPYKSDSDLLKTK